jgi:hypothetical protein
VAETPDTLGQRLNLAEVDTDRRLSKRFPIECAVRYQTMSQRAEILAGNGKTLNISSSGVLFKSDHDLPVGTRLEVSISWPVPLNERCRLNLVARGRVIRHMKGRLAMQIQQYEFRTQGRADKDK